MTAEEALEECEKEILHYQKKKKYFQDLLRKPVLPYQEENKK